MVSLLSLIGIDNSIDGIASGTTLVVNNIAVGAYNTADNVIYSTATVALDTETRVVDAFNNVVDRWTTLAYDIIEMVSYALLLFIVVIIVTLFAFHDEIFFIVSSIVSSLSIAAKNWADSLGAFRYPVK